MRLTPSRVRLVAIVGGGLLLVGLSLGPRLTGPTLLAFSVIWLATLLGLCLIAFVVMARWLGRPLTALLAVLGIGAVGVLTGVDWSGPLAVSMPCRRNWGWMPSYLLRASPTAAVRFAVDSVRVKLCYGRPSARGRRMIGGTYVPFGRLWRTGANEPTTIRATGPIVIAGIRVPTGKASIYTIPGPETWEIVVNRETSQWGIESAYASVQAGELGRTVLPSRPSETHVESLTFAPRGRDGGGAELVLQWERTTLTIPVVAQATEPVNRLPGKIQ